jgi:hypothetical protein
LIFASKYGIIFYVNVNCKVAEILSETGGQNKIYQGGRIMEEAKKAKELEEEKAEELSTQKKAEINDEMLDDVNGGSLQSPGMPPMLP